MMTEETDTLARSATAAAALAEALPEKYRYRRRAGSLTIPASAHAYPAPPSEPEYDAIVKAKLAKVISAQYKGWQPPPLTIYGTACVPAQTIPLDYEPPPPLTPEDWTAGAFGPLSPILPAPPPEPPGLQIPETAQFTQEQIEEFKARMQEAGKTPVPRQWQYPVTWNLPLMLHQPQLPEGV